MKRAHKIKLALLILTVCLILDRITKIIARAELASSPPISLLNNLVRFQYTENEGAMLSLGANLSPEFRFVFFSVIVGIVLAATFVLIVKTPGLTLWQSVSILVMLSGGVGNYIDRLFNAGAVIDFVSIGIGTIRTGIFNLADVFIMGGAIAFAWISIRHDDPLSPQPEGENRGLEDHLL